MSSWQLQDAKARFSELVREALSHGPQTVTVRGEPAVVVISQQQYRSLRAKAGKPKFTELMRSSPLAGLDFKIDRDHSSTRDITLDE